MANSLRFGNILNQLLAKLCCFGPIFIAVNGKIFKNNLAIWSHWISKTTYIGLKFLPLADLVSDLRLLGPESREEQRRQWQRPAKPQQRRRGRIRQRRLQVQVSVPGSVTRLGDFWTFFGSKFPIESSSNVWCLFRLFENIPFEVKTAVATFRATFGKLWATFYFCD